jgi:hypothetical protein
MLEEDGTTIVFPTLMRQLADDMRSIAARLAELNAGPLTTGAQRDTLATLEELLASLKKLREQRAQQAGGPMGGGGGGAMDAPLVPTSAELKMLKSSQLRINADTETAHKAIEENEPGGDDAHGLLQRAARRQTELTTMTREMQQRAERGHGP